MERRGVHLRYPGDRGGDRSDTEVVVLSTNEHVNTGSIVLIGPTAVGKSTVGAALAELLGWPLVELDALRSAWYPEFGLSPEGEHEAWERGGLNQLVTTWKPYELMSVERVMQENPTNTVIAFGGGQSVYTNSEMVQRAKAALEAASRVILLQPAEQHDDSLRILLERLRYEPFVTRQPAINEFLRAFTPILEMQLQSESNVFLATELIITGQSSPPELANHIYTTMETR